MRRAHAYERRHGRLYPDGKITKEEEIAEKFVQEMKEEALTIGQAIEVMEIVRAMMNECRLS